MTNFRAFDCVYGQEGILRTGYIGTIILTATIAMFLMRCDIPTKRVSNEGRFLTCSDSFHFVTFVDTTILDSGSSQLTSLPKRFITTTWTYSPDDDSVLSRVRIDSALFPDDFCMVWKRDDTVAFLGHTFLSSDSAEYLKLENTRKTDETTSVTEEIIDSFGPVYLLKETGALSLEFSYLTSEHMIYWGMKMPDSQLETAETVIQRRKEEYAIYDSVDAGEVQRLPFTGDRNSLDTTTVYAGKLFFR